jgi:hypothetical protein
MATLEELQEARDDADPGSAACQDRVVQNDFAPACARCVSLYVMTPPFIVVIFGGAEFATRATNITNTPLLTVQMR